MLALLARELQLPKGPLCQLASFCSKVASSTPREMNFQLECLLVILCQEEEATSWDAVAVWDVVTAAQPDDQQEPQGLVFKT